MFVDVGDGRSAWARRWRLSRPIDPLSDLAKALEGRVRAIDDDEPNDDERLPIEDAVEPKNGGSGPD